MYDFAKLFNKHFQYHEDNAKIPRRLALDNRSERSKSGSKRRDKERRALRSLIRWLSLLRDIAYEEDYVNSSDRSDLRMILREVEGALENGSER